MDDKNFDISKLSQEELEKIAGGKLDRKFLSGTIAGLSLLTGSPALAQTSAAGNSHSTQSISINQENPTPGTQNEERVVSEDGEYTFKDGKLIIFKGNKNSEVSGDLIKTVDKSKIKEVEIKDGITSIGSSAFLGCENLSELKLNPSNKLMAIRDGAFSDCKKLKKIMFLDNLVYIGSSAFLNCENLEKIDKLTSVKTISTFAFSGCKNLKEIDLPINLTFIGWRTFENCTALEEIVIPDSIEHMPNGVFEGCANLKNIIVKSEMEYELKKAIEKDIPNCKINGKELKDIKETSVK